MSACGLLHPPWASTWRFRLRWDLLTRNIRQSQATFRASFQFHTDAPGWDGIKTHQYPSSRPDLSFFEDQDLEYESIIKDSQPPPLPHSPSDTLVYLLKAGKYEDANGLRAELEDLGTTIKPDYACLEAARALLQLPKPTKHIDTFASWLAMLPEAEAERPLAIREFLDILLQSPKQNLPLIIKFGQICASKGYRDLVRGRLFPVVAKYADAATYDQFSKDVDAEVEFHEQRLNFRIYRRPIRSFSKESVLPSNVASEPPAAQPVAHDVSPIVVASSESSPISAEVVQVLKPPCPLDSTESAMEPVFEDMTEEYEVTSSYESSEISRNGTHDVLESLVKAKKFDEANELLSELLAVNTYIPPSLVYEFAAQHAIQNRNDSARQVEEFSRWFSLIPPAHEGRGRRKFFATRKLIFLAQATNLMLIMRFGIICAQKGFGYNVFHAVLPAVLRYAELDVSKQYLRDFEAAHVAYVTRHSSLTPVEQALKAVSQFRSFAVKQLAATGRAEEALHLLPTEQQLRSGEAAPLLANACSLLLSRLRATAPDRQLDPNLAAFVSLSINFSQAKHRPYRDFGTAVISTDTGITEGGLVAFMQSLKHGMAARRYPHCQTVVNFLEAYCATGRTKAVILLRNKALRTSRRWGGVWLCAELLYYRRQGQYQQLLKTFVDHFYLTGVPREELFARLHSWGHSPEAHAEEVRVEKGKLAPLPYHISLLWHALVGLTERVSQLPPLYNKLKLFARQQPFEDQEVLARMATSQPPPLLPQPNQCQYIDASAFTPFLRAFTTLQGPRRGAAILSDMTRLGIKPTVYQFTELAGCFARRGQVGRVFLLMDFLEQDFKLNATPESRDPEPAEDGLTPDESESAAISRDLHQATLLSDLDEEDIKKDRKPEPLRSQLPLPNIVLYTCVLRGFVEAENLQAAVRLQYRLTKRIPDYTTGSDPQLDAMIAKLMQLKVDMTNRRSRLKLMPGSLSSKILANNRTLPKV